jgi:alanine racemase
MNQWSNESMSQSSGRPTWAEVDLDALAHNFYAIRRHLDQNVRVLAAVKANAYGHGAVECSRRLEKEGADWFGVALPEEAVELRNAGIQKPILCLGGFWDGQQDLCLAYDLTPVVYRLDAIEALNRAAIKRNVTVDVHVKIDTGMGRLGVRSQGLNYFCNTLRSFEKVRVTGLMTHLAAADEAEQSDFTNRQLEQFERAIAAFREQGFAPAYIHAANSAGIFSFTESWGNLVRPGGTLYGFADDVLSAEATAPSLQPVMSLHTRIMLLKEVPRGEKLGYGCTFETKRDSLIATLPIGYDDGYRRALSNCGRVIVRGVFVPVVGRVSMDLTMIDVTDVPNASLNDQVTLLGTQGNLSIKAEELGRQLDTISYEISCGISNRVPRKYLEQ